MADALLLESGGYLLTESGGHFLLEASNDNGSGGGATIQPIFGTVAVLDGRTIAPLRTTSSPLAWVAPFDPADNAPYVFDLNAFLDASPLDTVTSATISAAAAALGVEIDAANPPVVDQAGKRIAIWLKVADAYQGPSYFAGPVKAAISIEWTTVGSAGVPVETYQRSGNLTVVQL